MAASDSVHPETSDPIFRYGPWTWAEPRHTEHFRRCSFCGSVHPEDLAVEPLWQAKWADQKYGWPHKFYVDIPNHRPDQLYAIGWASRFEESDRAKGYTPFEELTEEQLAIVERDRSGYNEPGTGVYFGTRPNHFGKFYTIHLNDPNISDDVKETIQRKSGLRIEFKDSRIHWQAYNGR